MKALIFGISGFVGPYLAREFLDNGYTVFGSDVVYSKVLPKDVSFRKTDLLNAEDTYELISDISPDMIVNLAAISSVGASWNIPQKTIEINVIGTLNILEAARKQEKKPRVLFVGSSEEYMATNMPMDEETPLDANNPYGISKVTQERFAELYRQRYGMKVYCVRPFNHTGVGQSDSFVLPSFCKQAAEIEKSGKPGVIKVGNLSAKRDFSHVKDVVRAYRMIIESDDCTVTYNVGSGIAHKLEDLLIYLLHFSKQEIQVEIDRDRYRPIDTPFICCDNRLIQKNIGWKPELSVFDALHEMVEYYLTRK